MAEFVYESPPLVEVIAEVHWHIERLSTIPDGGVDPQFSGLVTKLEQALPSAGFPVVERLVPPQVPVELLADKPIVRFWTRDKTWPLIQVGPGIMTVNIVPPYEGWRAFKPTIVQALEQLSTHYPLADSLLKIERAELRYIDAFTKRNGFTTYPKFVNERLGFQITLPMGIAKSTNHPPEESVSWAADISFPIRDVANNFGVVRIRPGTVNDQSAAVMECAVRWNDPNGIPFSDLSTWYDKAHQHVSDWFFALAEEPLLETFGAKRNISS